MLGDLGAVAGDHDDAVDPPAAERADSPARVGTDRVFHHQDSRRRTVGRDEHGQRTVEPGPPPRQLRPRGRAAHPGPGRLAHRHPVPADRSADALPGHLLHVVRHHQLAPFPCRCAHDRAGQDMLGHLIQGRGQAQHVPRGQRARSDDPGHRRVPAGERPGLVDEHGRAPGEPLQHRTTLDHHAAAGRDGQAGYQRDRGRQDQRARRGHDQHRHGPRRPGERPRDPGCGQAHAQEPQRVTVGQPDEGGLRSLGFGHQADDPGVGAVLRRGRGPQIERPARVHHAAADQFPGGPLDGTRLTSQRRLVQDRGRGRQGAVHGDELTGRDYQQVASRDRVEWHHFQRPAGVTPRGPRGPLQQGAHVPVSATGRPGLQRPPARQHDADHRGGQQLTDGHRAQQGQQRDGIHPGPAPAQRVHHRPQGVRRATGPGGQPGSIPGLRRAGQLQDPARRQGGKGHGEQDQRNLAPEPGQLLPRISQVHVNDHAPAAARRSRAIGWPGPGPPARPRGAPTAGRPAPQR